MPGCIPIQTKTHALVQHFSKYLACLQAFYRFLSPKVPQNSYFIVASVKSGWSCDHVWSNSEFLKCLHFHLPSGKLKWQWKLINVLNRKIHLHSTRGPCSLFAHRTKRVSHSPMLPPCPPLIKKKANPSCAIGWFQPSHLKNMIVTIGSFPPISGMKIPKIFESPPPRNLEKNGTPGPASSSAVASFLPAASDAKRANFLKMPCSAGRRWGPVGGAWFHHQPTTRWVISVLRDFVLKKNSISATINYQHFAKTIDQQ